MIRFRKRRREGRCEFAWFYEMADGKVAETWDAGRGYFLLKIDGAMVGTGIGAPRLRDIRRYLERMEGRRAS